MDNMQSKVLTFVIVGVAWNIKSDVTDVWHKSLNMWLTFVMSDFGEVMKLKSKKNLDIYSHRIA